ncbi:MAG: (d)CMP kinase [Kiloniellales bacterium]|nr:(d)CMP kinase [Kiloniellales bacterium]
MIIAVDGPSAAGKGTLARALAARLGFAHLDSGMIYRAVAAAIDLAEDDPGFAAAARRAAEALTPADLARPGLRDERISHLASRVAAIPEVRTALLAFQRNFAENPPAGAPGAVLDGRDIGTVVCPEADLKLFVTASTEERARRRHKELRERGEESIYARVLQDLQTRDARDSQRAVAPLRAAEDAIVLDTTELDSEAALAAAMDIVAARGRRD